MESLARARELDRIGRRRWLIVAANTVLACAGVGAAFLLSRLGIAVVEATMLLRAGL